MPEKPKLGRTEEAIVMPPENTHSLNLHLPDNGQDLALSWDCGGPETAAAGLWEDLPVWPVGH